MRVRENKRKVSDGGGGGGGGGGTESLADHLTSRQNVRPPVRPNLYDRTCRDSLTSQDKTGGERREAGGGGGC